MNTRIRLTCWICDAEEDCTITLKRAKELGWTEIYRERSYERATATIGENPLFDGDDEVLDWFTHAGYCPDCSKATGS